MKLSSKSRYGLRICYVLAESYPEHVSATFLEKNIGVSSKYIEKIMRLLIHDGIVLAERGASGGYHLTRRPEDVTVGSIVRALEEEMEFITCVSEGNSCACPTKGVWQKLYRGINDVLDSITLKNMLDDNKNKDNSDKCNMEGTK